MIDTIVLLITPDLYHITNPDTFTPSARWALKTAAWAHGIQSKQNPLKRELLRGIYKPRLTISQRANINGMREAILKIELSLPKLFFGNNFQELRYKDFRPLVQRLQDVLAQMGVIMNEQALMGAPVSAIHYSKNIPLTDGSTPYHFINKIKESNTTLSLDVNCTDYRNEGHSYKWHCNAYEVVFYDKIRDLEAARKSSKRVLEKDSVLQLNLFDALQKRKKWELLRMEVRLNKRTKIKQLFSKLGIASDFTFKDLFKPAISKKVLLYYLDEIARRRPSLLDYKASSDKALLTTLLINNPELGPKRIMQMFGLKKILETMTIRELRVILANYNQRSWYRLMMDANAVTLPNAQNPFKIIREQLIAFRAVKKLRR